jgi:hypothetical protein
MNVAAPAKADPQAEPVQRPGRAIVPPPDTGGNMRQFLFQLNGTLKQSLHEQTREAVVAVTPKEMLRLVHAIARQRGRYLASVLEAGGANGGVVSAAELAHLRRARETYDELRFGFEALKIALESGEISLESSDRN